MLGISYENHQTTYSSQKYSVDGFPSHYYPKDRLGLSPRQAEALGRHGPPRTRTDSNASYLVSTPGTTPRHSLVPDFPSQHRQGCKLPREYHDFVAAPTVHSPFGNFPELRNPNYRSPAVHQIPVHIHPSSEDTKPDERGKSPQGRESVPGEVFPKDNLQQGDSYPEQHPLSGPLYGHSDYFQPSNEYEHYPDHFEQGDEEVQPNATMETTVTGQGQPKRVGRWTLAQLRQTDGIIPSQAGWNKGDSQKLMTNFGSPRNTNTRVKADNIKEIPEEIAQRTHGEVRLQSGTNKYASQRGMTNFGSGRDVCREGNKVSQNPAGLPELPEEKIRMSDGIVRLQAGTNKYDSQKGMTCMGTGRRETTKIKDTKHPEYDHEKPDQSEIPLQSGTNKFASQKGMTCMGTNRRETCRIVDTAHPEYNPESSIDSSTIPYQMGTNKYASQKGMTGFGQPRWEVLDPSISWQNRKSQGMVRLQSGTNRFASQAGMTGFGTIRNTTYEAEAGELPYEDMKKSETIIPSQAGWNRGDSQRGMTSFGASRDVKGKHLKRIWELEYPEEAEISLDRL